MKNVFCLVVAAVTIPLCLSAMPSRQEQKMADAKVRKIMGGFRDQGDAVQADMALKASESAKTEGERFLLIRGAYLKSVKAGEYDKAVAALDALQFRVKEVPEALLKELLEKGLKDAPVGKADKLAAVKKALEDGCPRVIMTDPENGALNVNAKTDRIRIWFDRPMCVGMSLCGEWPKPQSKPTYDETCKCLTIPVQLIPGKVYTMGLNSKSHKGFASVAGVAMQPYQYSFSVGK